MPGLSLANTCQYHSCQGSSMDPSVSCWAPKKQITSYVNDLLKLTPLLAGILANTWPGEQHMHAYTTHTHVHNTLLTLVRTAHAHTKWQLGLQVYTELHTSIHAHVTEVVTDACHNSLFKMVASSSLYKIPMQEILADRNFLQEIKV